MLSENPQLSAQASGSVEDRVVKEIAKSEQVAAKELAEILLKRWAVLVDLIKIVITLSTAILGGWTALISDTSKMPAGWTKWIVFAASVCSLLSILSGLSSFITMNTSVVEIFIHGSKPSTSGHNLTDGTLRSPPSDAQVDRKRLIGFLANLSAGLFAVSVALLLLFVLMRTYQQNSDNSGKERLAVQVHSYFERDYSAVSVRLP